MGVINILRIGLKFNLLLIKKTPNQTIKYDFENRSWVKFPKALKKEAIKRFYLQLHYELMNLQFKLVLLINFHVGERKFIVLIRSSKPGVIKTHKVL